MKQIINNKCVTFKTEKGFKGFNIRKGKAVESSKYLKVLDSLNVDVI